MTSPDDAGAPSARTRVNRYRHLAHYDRETIDAILDAMPVAHVAYLHEGQPIVTPTLQWREGDRVYWHGAKHGRMMQATEGADVCLTVSNSRRPDFGALRLQFQRQPSLGDAVRQGPGGHRPRREVRLLTRLVNGFAPDQWDKLRPATDAEINVTAILSLKIEEASAKVRSGPPEDNEDDYAHPVWAGVLPIRLTVGAPEPDPRNLPGVAAPDLSGYLIG